MGEAATQLSPEQRAAREQELEDLKFVMASPQGRRFIKRFLDDGHVFHPCYTGNSETFYREGKREFALKYFNDVLQSCPEKWHLMMQENKKG